MSFAQMYIVYFHICLISAHWQSYFSALAVSYKYKDSQPVVMMQRMQRENTMVRQIRVIIVDQDDDNVTMTNFSLYWTILNYLLLYHH